MKARSRHRYTSPQSEAVVKLHTLQAISELKFSMDRLYPIRCVKRDAKKSLVR